MTLEEMRGFIAAHDWTFAKSMPKVPHFYVVREKCRSHEEFVQAVTLIRKYGVPRSFYRKSYIYLDLDGWSYWTMGNSLEITKIINRAEIKCE
jgi:nitrate reductase alpha subunit